MKHWWKNQILFEESLELYSPEFVIEEFMKYEYLIVAKTHRTSDDFVQIMHSLKNIIKVVLKEEYSSFIKEAETVSPDEKDVMYFALALKLGCGLWSNDKKLKEQNKVKVYSTPEVANLI